MKKQTMVNAVEMESENTYITRKATPRAFRQSNKPNQSTMQEQAMLAKVNLRATTGDMAQSTMQRWPREDQIPIEMILI